MNLYETVTGTILEALRNGVVPWRKPWYTASRLPINAGSGRPYRGINVFLLSMKPYTDHRWLTFKQARDLGGHVRSGEKSTLVVFWKHWEPPSKPDDDQTESVQRIPLLRRFSVFNVEQTEGLDLPGLSFPDQLRESQRIANADLIVDAMPDKPAIREAGQSAWYHSGEDLVSMPAFTQFETPDAYYATLFHELGHATGHPSRLNRPAVSQPGQLGHDGYSREELVAEFASAFCCAAAGLDNSLQQNAASYIGGWLKALKDDPKAAVIAAGQAQRAADYIRGIS